MKVRFSLTFWSPYKKTGEGYITHCIEMQTTHEAKGGHSAAKSHIRAINQISDLFDVLIKEGILEDELLCRGWVVIKTFSTVNWVYPNPEQKLGELQHIFGEAGHIHKDSFEKDIPHAPKRSIRNMVTDTGTQGDTGLVKI